MRDNKQQPIITGSISLPLHLNNNLDTVNVELYLYDFGDTGRYHVLKFPGSSEKPIVRIESACTFAMVYNSGLCDCRKQLEKSIEILSNESGGILIYCLDENGRGIGDRDNSFQRHIEVYMEEQRNHVDTATAHENLKYPVDGRNYDNIKYILKSFDITKIYLLTNNPNRIKYFTDSNMLINRIPLLIHPDKLNIMELTAKRDKLGHLLDHL